MNIVITGAAGFVGKALVEALRTEHKITAIDREPWISGPVPGVRILTGDLTHRPLLNSIFKEPCDAVIHLATMPGGAAEADPAGARAINVDATMMLIDAAAAAGNRPRFVFASSVAVFGSLLPSAVDDTTKPNPDMLYGGHKAMMEMWIALQSRRGAIDGLSLRLPAIVARPRGPSGMKSAYLSDLFHNLVGGTPICLPVSPSATSWMLSRQAAVDALVHAVSLVDVPRARCLTLPALRLSIADLVAEAAAHTGANARLVTYAPDPAVETAFGSHPPLATAAAIACGFRHDGTVATLAARALADMDLQRN